MDLRVDRINGRDHVPDRRDANGGKLILHYYNVALTMFDKMVHYIQLRSLIVTPTGNCASKKKLYGFPTLSLTIANGRQPEEFLAQSRDRKTFADILYLCLSQVYFFRYVIENKPVYNCMII